MDTERLWPAEGEPASQFIARCQNPEDYNPNNSCRENLKYFRQRILLYIFFSHDVCVLVPADCTRDHSVYTHVHFAQYSIIDLNWQSGSSKGRWKVVLLLFLIDREGVTWMCVDVGRGIICVMISSNLWYRWAINMSFHVKIMLWLLYVYSK